MAGGHTVRDVWKELRRKLVAAKPAGTKSVRHYTFRTNEAAADVALRVFTVWLAEELGWSVDKFDRRNMSAEECPIPFPGGDRAELLSDGGWVVLPDVKDVRWPGPPPCWARHPSHHFACTLSAGHASRWHVAGTSWKTAVAVWPVAEATP
jgi:hypothetical protein